MILLAAWRISSTGAIALLATQANPTKVIKSTVGIAPDIARKISRPI